MPIKPKKLAKQSAGVRNERFLANVIQDYIDNNGPLDVSFADDRGKIFTVRGVISTSVLGNDVTGRKKADIYLHTSHTNIPVSIKQRNADYWESADGYFGDSADYLIEKLQENGMLKLFNTPKARKDGVTFVKVYPEVALRATKQEAIDVVFGTDILKENGVVVKQTFRRENFILDKSDLLIMVHCLMSKIEDLPEHSHVYFLVRNDISRTRPKSCYPGIRVLAAYKRRLHRNVLVLD